ncbi:NADP-dependent 3-hydroxy acid dehydrogenase YdfG [Friedmanniella endophytica]|uniref:NADP-dependent 3-hydroxy acid dehydrogenase YdfG n=1 Tax=Microlunatus kandeliicorticis TaxID=1759536 RepID=A0A7W3IRB7_9ACTN|nr:SDR family NAD(P)-dependent oxidoreductase [Microlunatus kandeliicorticis]MBA8793806.1 NADP-dependent 3-hydroxy acid dehydrogenase YdfG [Microlunatus kandeliicorticis]
MTGLDGRTVWVTGAGSGMGRASAVAAAAAGARVVLSGRRREALEETARLAEQAGPGGALVVPVDVADAAAVRAAREQTGPVTDLVLAAGLNAKRRTWADQQLDEVQAIVDVNLTGVLAVVDATLPDLRTAGGQVVVVSSYSGWRFSPGAGVAYSATKTALASVCQMLNAQEAAHGVRACHLCPGDVATDFLELRPNVPDADARAVMLTPEDVAATVAFVLQSPPHVRIDELVISPVSQA